MKEYQVWTQQGACMNVAQGYANKVTSKTPIVDRLNRVLPMCEAELLKINGVWVSYDGIATYHDSTITRIEAVGDISATWEFRKGKLIK